MTQAAEYSVMLATCEPMGWHMRPAGMLVSIAKMFESDIVVKFGKKIASAKSLLEILMLGAGRGAKIYVSARGRDAQLAIKAIRNTFSTASATASKAASQPSRNGDTHQGKNSRKEDRVKVGSAPARKAPAPVSIPTTFIWTATPESKQVFLAGDFNGWDPQSSPMTRRANKFSKSIKLAPGQYQYKFLVDGVWHADQSAPLTVSNLGSTNNIIHV
jgi:phosphotransferase system HPr (HPr) family protein